MVQLLSVWFFAYVTVFGFSAGFTSMLVALKYPPPEAGLITAVGAFGFLGCALFAVWRLSTVRLRLRMLEMLCAWPGLCGAAWLGRLREHTRGEQLRACGGCGSAGNAAPNRGVNVFRGIVPVGNDDRLINYLALVRNRQTMLRRQFTELFVGEAHNYWIRIIIKRSEILSTDFFSCDLEQGYPLQEGNAVRHPKLFISQCDHGVHFGRAARRDVARYAGNPR